MLFNVETYFDIDTIIDQNRSTFSRQKNRSGSSNSDSDTDSEESDASPVADFLDLPHNSFKLRLSNTC
jgi:hypothetical protein